MVMMVEGVHQGSAGALYYPASSFADMPSLWNQRPVVVYHPTRNGAPISASADPQAVNEYKIGVIMNATWDGAKLRAEAWLREDRMATVDQRVLDAVQNGTMLELSTGMFMVVSEGEGEWNGERYIGIASSFKPDHLAVLPDVKGACSIADGAGFIRNMAQHQLSFRQTEIALMRALRQSLSLSEDEEWPWPCDVYSDYAIYEYQSKFFKIDFSVAADSTITLTGGPVEVLREVVYRPIDTIMNREENIKALVANHGWDAAALESFSDEQVQSVLNAATVAAVAADSAQSVAVNAAVTDAVFADADLEAKASDALKAVINAGRAALQAEADKIAAHKADMVAKLSVNAAFTSDELNAMDVGMLEKLAKLATPATPAAVVNNAPDYTGQAGDVRNVVNNDSNAPDLP
jgi:hypothetical protein